MRSGRPQGNGLRADRFAKEKIALAPNNSSAWNYLRGVLEQTKTPLSELTAFVRLYTISGASPPPEVMDLDNPAPTEGAQLPAVNALEFLADIYEEEGGDKIPKAVEVRPLSQMERRTCGVDAHTSDLEVVGERARYYAEEVSGMELRVTSSLTDLRRYWEYRIREALAANV